MNEKKIVYISAEHIHPHPGNPRKDLGDLSELADSIKKNGILQNLTVIPVDGELGEYMTIIGHRRFAAGKMVDVAEYPCQIIEGLTEREQMSIMLEENMQRTDLTILEQANGFQLMLDLGETEQSISEKTGFSRSTVRHRLNIAKLDQKKLKEKENEDGFQLTLTDLYELEKVEDIETRNKILDRATDSRNLAYLAKQEVEQRKKNRIKTSCIEKLEGLGVKKAPDGTEYQIYSGKWNVVKTLPFDEEPEETIDLGDSTADLFYTTGWNRIDVVRKAKKEKKELTPEELENKRKEGNRKELKAIWKDMTVTRRKFIEDIISGKVPPLKEADNLKDELFELLMEYYPCIGINSLLRFFLGDNSYKAADGEREDVKEKARNLSVLHQIMCLVSVELADSDLMTWDFKYYVDHGDRAMRFYDILKRYGFSFTDDRERDVVNGSSELYERKE